MSAYYLPPLAPDPHAMYNHHHHHHHQADQTRLNGPLSPQNQYISNRSNEDKALSSMHYTYRVPSESGGHPLTSPTLTSTSQASTFTADHQNRSTARHLQPMQNSSHHHQQSLPSLSHSSSRMPHLSPTLMKLEPNSYAINAASSPSSSSNAAVPPMTGSGVASLVPASGAATISSSPSSASSSASPLPFVGRRKTPSSWDPHDDFLLRHLKEQRKLGWKEIALHFPNRTTNACQFRWRRLVSGTLRSAPASTKFGMHKFSNHAGPGPDFLPAHLAKTDQYGPSYQNYGYETPSPHQSVASIVSATPNAATVPGTAPPVPAGPLQPTSARPISSPTLSNPIVNINSTTYSHSHLPSSHHQNLHQSTNSTETNLINATHTNSASPILSANLRLPSSGAATPRQICTTQAVSVLSDDELSRSPTSPASSITSLVSEKEKEQPVWTVDQDEILLSRSDLRPEELSLLLDRSERDIITRIAQLKKPQPAYKVVESGPLRRPEIPRKMSNSHFDGLHLPVPIVRR